MSQQNAKGSIHEAIMMKQIKRVSKMKIQSNTMKERKTLMKQLKKEYLSQKCKVALEKKKKM